MKLTYKKLKNKVFHTGYIVLNSTTREQRAQKDVFVVVLRPQELEVLA